jgi:hypothetical protein
VSSKLNGSSLLVLAAAFVDLPDARMGHRQSRVQLDRLLEFSQRVIELVGFQQARAFGKALARHSLLRQLATDARNGRNAQDGNAQQRGTAGHGPGSLSHPLSFLRGRPANAGAVP